MKKIALVSTLIFHTFSTAALAQESLKSLSYRPAKNEFNLQAGVAILGNKIDLSDISTQEIDTTVVNAELNYGFLDELSFGISLGIPVNTDAKISNQDIEYENKGISDIGLNSSYRYLNSNFKGDLLVGLNISGEKETKIVNGKTEADFKSGNHSLDVGTKVSNTSGDLEVAALAGLKYNLEKKLKDASGITKIKPSLDFNLGAMLQFNILPKISFGFITDVALKGKLKSKDNPNNGQKSYVQVLLGTDLKYLVSEKLMMRLAFDSTLGSDLKDLDGQVSTKDFKESSLSLAAHFNF